MHQILNIDFSFKAILIKISFSILQMLHFIKIIVYFCQFLFTIIKCEIQSFFLFTNFWSHSIMILIQLFLYCRFFLINKWSENAWRWACPRMPTSNSRKLFTIQRFIIMMSNFKQSVIFLISTRFLSLSFFWIMIVFIKVYKIIILPLMNGTPLQCPILR